MTDQDDFRGRKRPPNFYWLPEATASGTKYHAKICGAHLLEAYPANEAIPMIRRQELEPCKTCMNHHGLEPIDGGDQDDEPDINPLEVEPFDRDDGFNGVTGTGKTMNMRHQRPNDYGQIISQGEDFVGGLLERIPDDRLDDLIYIDPKDDEDTTEFLKLSAIHARRSEQWKSSLAMQLALSKVFNEVQQTVEADVGPDDPREEEVSAERIMEELEAELEAMEELEAELEVDLGVDDDQDGDDE